MSQPIFCDGKAVVPEDSDSELTDAVLQGRLSDVGSSSVSETTTMKLAQAWFLKYYLHKRYQPQQFYKCICLHNHTTIPTSKDNASLRRQLAEVVQLNKQQMADMMSKMQSSTLQSSPEPPPSNSHRVHDESPGKSSAKRQPPATQVLDTPPAKMQRSPASQSSENQSQSSASVSTSTGGHNPKLEVEELEC